MLNFNAIEVVRMYEPVSMKYTDSPSNGYFYIVRIRITTLYLYMLLNGNRRNNRMPLKIIEIETRKVIREEKAFIVEEINNFEELKKLRYDSMVGIMNNCSMVLGRIMYMEENFVLIDIVTDTVSVNKSSFTGKNYLCKVIEETWSY